MRNKFAAFLTLLLLFVFSAQAQPPRPHPPPSHWLRDWFERIDANKNGAVERSEFDGYINFMFKNAKKNVEGIFEETGLPPPPQHRGENGAPPPRPNAERLGGAQ